MAVVLLTGATGFLGSHLLRECLTRGDEVHLLLRASTDYHRIAPMLQQVQVHGCDQQSIQSAIRKFNFDTVVHTACSYGRHGTPVSEVIESNILFGLRILQEIAETGHSPMFINIDTLLPRDLNVYSRSKAQFREWLRYYSGDLPIRNVKVEFMYGEGDDPGRFVAWLIQRLAGDDEMIDLTEGDQMRDFIYVSDVVAACVKVAEQTKDNGDWLEFEVGSGQLFKLREFIVRVCSNLENRLGRELVHRLRFGGVEYRRGEPMAPAIDIRPLQALGWRAAVSLDDGINRTIEAML